MILDCSLTSMSIKWECIMMILVSDDLVKPHDSYMCWILTVKMKINISFQECEHGILCVCSNEGRRYKKVFVSFTFVGFTSNSLLPYSFDTTQYVLSWHIVFVLRLSHFNIVLYMSYKSKRIFTFYNKQTPTYVYTSSYFCTYLRLFVT